MLYNHTYSTVKNTFGANESPIFPLCGCGGYVSEVEFGLNRKYDYIDASEFPGFIV